MRGKASRNSACTVSNEIPGIAGAVESTRQPLALYVQLRGQVPLLPDPSPYR